MLYALRLKEGGFSGEGIMAMYPDRDGDYMMTEPGSFVLDRNTNVVRIIMHQTWAFQAILNQAPINYRIWTDSTRDAHETNVHSQ